MARVKLAACIASLFVLQAPHLALAQDAEEEETAPDTQEIDTAGDPEPDSDPDPDPDPDQPVDDGPADDGPVEDGPVEDDPVDDGSSDGPTAEDPDVAGEVSEPLTDAANEELLANTEIEQNVEDVLIADDQFNDDELGDVADDSVAVETGSDGIADVFELYDEDGEPAFDEESEATNPGYQAGMFFERLPVLRKPPGRGASPMTLELPSSQLASALALADAPRPKAGLGQLGRKWFGAAPAVGPAAAALSGQGGPTAAPLRLITGISGGFALSQGASSVYLVKDGGAPYQAQVNYATDPASWGPNFKEFDKYPDWEARHICGGTLIAPNWVLSAAHCFLPKPGSNAQDKLNKGINVLLGAENLAQPKSGMTYKVDRVVLHSGFRPGFIYRHDIALLHIVSNRQTSRVNQISTIRRHAGAEPGDRTAVSVTGWGKTTEIKRQLAATALWRADVKLIATPRCAALPNYGKIDPARNSPDNLKLGAGTLCAGESRGKACSGDSGGPLVFTNIGPPQLVGVTSWTVDKSCGNPNLPNVYTRVGAYDKWIEDAMRSPGQPGKVTKLP